MMFGRLKALARRHARLTIHPKIYGNRASADRVRPPRFPLANPAVGRCAKDNETLKILSATGSLPAKCAASKEPNTRMGLR